jgi:hypothetical protein
MRHLISKLALPLALVGLLGAAAPHAQAATAPPFLLDLVPVDSHTLPALHSFVVGEANGKWLVLGGRTNGVHLFVSSSDGGSTPPPNAFPPAQANRSLWVIDPQARQAWSSPLQNLKPAIADALSATNANGAQDDKGNLIVVGGYGLDSASKQMITFSTVTVLQVANVINAIIAGQPVDKFITQYTSVIDCPQWASNAYNACVSKAQAFCKQGQGWSQCMSAATQNCLPAQAQQMQTCATAVLNGTAAGKYPVNKGYYTQVAGGGLKRLGNVFYLAFGQNFQGLYSVNEGDYGKWPVNQVYTERLVMLGFSPDLKTLGVLGQVLQDQNDPLRQFHRRDLNVLPAITPSGTPSINAYGGVFVPGETGAYRQPIVITQGSGTSLANVTVDTSYQQFMSQYECAAIPLYDRTAKSMSTVLVGGISLYYLDRKTGELQMDEGLPFIDNLTVLTAAGSQWAEYVRRQPLDGRIGANGHFGAAPGLAQSSNGVLYVDGLKNRTLLGWVYGGIYADVPHAGDSTGHRSKASNTLYEVWLTPTAPASGYWVQASSVPTKAAAPPATTQQPKK